MTWLPIAVVLVGHSDTHEVPLKYCLYMWWSDDLREATQEHQNLEFQDQIIWSSRFHLRCNHNIVLSRSRTVVRENEEKLIIWGTYFLNYLSLKKLFLQDQLGRRDIMDGLGNPKIFNIYWFTYMIYCSYTHNSSEMKGRRQRCQQSCSCLR